MGELRYHQQLQFQSEHLGAEPASAAGHVMNVTTCFPYLRCLHDAAASAEADLSGPTRREALSLGRGPLIGKPPVTGDQASPGTNTRKLSAHASVPAARTCSCAHSQAPDHADDGRQYHRPAGEPQEPGAGGRRERVLRPRRRPGAGKKSVYSLITFLNIREYRRLQRYSRILRKRKLYSQPLFFRRQKDNSFYYFCQCC